MTQIKIMMAIALLTLFGCSEKKEPNAPAKPSAEEKRSASGVTDYTNPKKNFTSEADFMKFDVAGFYAGMTKDDADKRLASEGWTDGRWSGRIDQFANEVANNPGLAIDTTSGVWFRGDESIALYQYQPVNGPRSIWGVTYKRKAAQIEAVAIWVQRLKDKYGTPLKEKTSELRSDLTYGVEVTPDIKAREEVAHYKLRPELTATVIGSNIEIRYSNPLAMESMLKERWGILDAQSKQNAGSAKQGF